jgi:hypothetical protein
MLRIAASSTGTSWRQRAMKSAFARLIGPVR